MFPTISQHLKWYLQIASFVQRTISNPNTLNWLSEGTKKSSKSLHVKSWNQKTVLLEKRLYCKSAGERHARFPVGERNTDEADQDRPGRLHNEQLISLSDILMPIWQLLTTAESGIDTVGRLCQASSLL